MFVDYEPPSRAPSPASPSTARLAVAGHGLRRRVPAGDPPRQVQGKDRLRGEAQNLAAGWAARFSGGAAGSKLASRCFICFCVLSLCVFLFLYLFVFPPNRRALGLSPDRLRGGLGRP